MLLRVVQPRLHGSLADAGELRDLRDRQITSVPHRHNDLLVDVESRHGSSDLVSELRRPVSGWDRIGLDHQALARPFAELRAADIDDDPREPGLGAVWVPQASAHRPRPQRRFLDRVFGSDGVTQDASGQPVGGVEAREQKRPHRLFPGRSRSGAHALHCPLDRQPNKPPQYQYI